jgi:general secretion pathway protein E
MVGEIRDRETAEIAVQSALTGHLVLTTVHANNVFDVFGRFTHMGIDPYAFVSALNGIWAQRLVRMNCPHCAVQYQPDDAELAAAHLERAGGGRLPLHARQGLRRLPRHRLQGAPLDRRDPDPERRDPRTDRRQAADPPHQGRRHANGTRSLRLAALDLVRRGATTIDEIRRVTLHA